jgi:hypothetical protein
MIPAVLAPERSILAQVGELALSRLIKIVEVEAETAASLTGDENLGLDSGGGCYTLPLWVGHQDGVVGET